jgi:hypothetical protein
MTTPAACSLRSWTTPIHAGSGAAKCDSFALFAALAALVALVLFNFEQRPPVQAFQALTLSLVTSTSQP